MTNTSYSNSAQWETYIDLEEGSADPTEQQEIKLEVDTAGTEVPEDPYTVRTRHSLATSPYSKGIVVASCALFGTGIVGLGFKLVTGGFAGSPAVVEQPKTATANPLDKGRLEEQQISQLKTQMAIGTQAAEIQKLNSSPLPATNKKASSKPVPNTAVAPTPPQRVVVAYSPPRPAPRAFTPPAPISKPVAIAPPRWVQPARSTAVPQDPMQQWQLAANAGSYGEMSPGDSWQPAANAAGDRSSTAMNSAALPSGGLGAAPSTLAQSQTQTSDPQTRYTSVNYATATRNLIVGTRAAGKLETPIAWSGQLQNPTQNFLIQLQEPLQTADSSVVVPKGAYIVARVSEAADSGLLQMIATSFVINENGQATEQSIPDGSLLILGKGGKILQAKARRRSSLGNDIASFLLSGVSQATQLMNRSTTETTIGTSGSFQTTTTNPEPNLMAGFIQGSTRSVVQRMQSRNQQARQSMQSEPRVFILDRGTSVQLFVNSSFSL